MGQGGGWSVGWVGRYGRVWGGVGAVGQGRVLYGVVVGNQQRVGRASLLWGLGRVGSRFR